MKVWMSLCTIRNVIKCDFYYLSGNTGCLLSSRWILQNVIIKNRFQQLYKAESTYYWRKTTTHQIVQNFGQLTHIRLKWKKYCRTILDLARKWMRYPKIGHGPKICCQIRLCKIPWRVSKQKFDNSAGHK